VAGGLFWRDEKRYNLRMTDQTQPNKKGFRRPPAWLIGAGVELIGVVTALVGFFWRHGNGWHLVWGLLGASVIGGLTWLFVARRFNFLLALLLTGFFSGIFSAWDLLLYEPFQNQFFVALVTAAFYIGSGLAIGIIVEFISYVHHLTHGHAPLDYPDREFKK
jgi:hypothetical protein